MKIDVITLFPDIVDKLKDFSVIGRALGSPDNELNVHNLRDFAINEYGSVDDRPYGGGPGMLLRVDVVVPAIEKIKENNPNSKVILTSPQGQRFNQKIAQDLAKSDGLIIICGHYEGFDNRIRDYVDQEISIGDYVLSGGELASMVIIDSVVRLLPGSLGNDKSSSDESFTQNSLESPQYTRPRDFRGQSVPDILISGDHGSIKSWKKQKSKEITGKKRPDLLT